MNPTDETSAATADALRALQSTRGSRYWRSLEELAGSPGFEELLHREFPQGASELLGGVSRRKFLQLAAASLALAGLGFSGCSRQPDEEIVPYVRKPEAIIPGDPLFFATALTLGGLARGVLVKSHMGRPIKIEGNPDHPASLGATDLFMQAELLSLYDPDRSQAVMHQGQIDTWSNFVAVMRTLRERCAANGGAGLRVLTQTVASPTLGDQLQQFARAFPRAKWHQHDAINNDAVYDGSRSAFGPAVETRYRFDQAAVIVSLDADFLGPGPASVRYARDFAAGRRARGGAIEMNRLYVAEPMPTITGAAADHRLPLKPNEVIASARWMAARLGVPVSTLALSEAARRWAEAAADDLLQHRGKGVFLAGASQPPAVHAIAHAVNAALGNTGATVIYTEPVVTNADSQAASLRELAQDMDQGRVETIVILGGNPVYDTPSDLEFDRLLRRVPLRVHLGHYQNETAALCHWHVPQSHELESWGDARAFDGTATIIQPLIAPLYDGKTAHEMLAILLDRPFSNAHTLVRDYWRAKGMGGDFEPAWRRALRNGVIADTQAATVAPTLREDWMKDSSPAAPDDSLQLIIRPDPTIWDGRYNNNGWLQECPKPITKLTWDNAAMLSPAEAQRRGVKNGQVVTLTVNDRHVSAPIWIVPGHADGCVTVHTGYGRRITGKVGEGAGFNAYTLRRNVEPWVVGGLTMKATEQFIALACTQEHQSIEGRDLLRVVPLEKFRKADRRDEEGNVPLSLYAHPHANANPHQQWGMVIDLSSCIGCNSCVVACQAENNSPIVGREQVAKGRQMHWIRIDRYFEGPPEQPQIHQQPVTCMHCEDAPCEVVCPVGATVHSDDGLNEMVYNRCIGTRYCSNNCPYKVRRFNFLDFRDKSESVQLMRNPEVTVRSGGVMEKCTYCVQRIRHAEIAAKKEDRPIHDGEVVTACQSACPAQAITFGNIADKTSAVTALRAQPHHYGMLAEQGTRPRTTYLSKITNPNAELDHG